MDEYSHPSSIAGFCLSASCRSGTDTSSDSLGTCFCLSSCCYSNGRCNGIGFEISNSEIIAGWFVLEKEDFTKCLATQLEPYCPFQKSCGPGYLTAAIYLPETICPPDTEARFTNRRKNRIAVGTLKKRVYRWRLFKCFDRS